jgi:Na+/melibiose symporter-like transporter
MGTLLFFGKRKLLAMTAVWAVASVLLYFLLPSAVQELLANMLTMVTLLAAINVVVRNSICAFCRDYV